MKGKQLYKCKYYVCNYIGSKNDYSDHIKLKAIKYYLEGNGFRRIEGIMGVSHVSVINWVKHFASKFTGFTRKTYCWSKSLNMVIMFSYYFIVISFYSLFAFASKLG